LRLPKSRFAKLSETKFKMTDATAFSNTLATVRQTNAAHVSALDALERAFTAGTVLSFTQDGPRVLEFTKRRGGDFDWGEMSSRLPRD
jgi:hypothetical protein